MDHPGGTNLILETDRHDWGPERWDPEKQKLHKMCMVDLMKFA